MHCIDILAPDGGSAGALGATLDVFDVANELADRPQFDVRLLSESGRVQVRGGLQTDAPAALSVTPRPVVFILGAGAATPAGIDARLSKTRTKQVCGWIHKAHRAGAIVAGSCTGVFFLGAAALLDGRNCTVTWWLGPYLQSRFKACRVSSDAMVIEDAGVWTAGAAFAQIDLALSLLERLSGRALAVDTARHLLAERRERQSPFMVTSHLAHQDVLVQDFEALIQARLQDLPRLDDVADELRVSSRTLDRRIRACIGLSPMRLAQRIRLRTAIDLLETTSLPHTEIAERVGYSDAATLYRLVVRHTGLRPGSFRRAPGYEP